MNIREAKLIHDLRVFVVANVSREHGRKRLSDLERAGKIKPLRTPTGRTLLSFDEAEVLSNSL